MKKLTLRMPDRKENGSAGLFYLEYCTLYLLMKSLYLLIKCRFVITFTVVFLWIAFTNASFCYSNEDEWVKILGPGAGYCVQQTVDEGYIITGTMMVADVCLIKTDSLGDTLWMKTYGGAEEDCGFHVKQTKDSGYIITGKTYSGFGTGGYDLYLIKTDSLGDTMWTKIFGTPYQDYGRCVQQTLDGGYIVTGRTGVPPELWLLKTDSLGDSLWAKTFYLPGVNAVGYWVKQLPDKGYAAVGYTYLGWEDWDAMLVRTDSMGNLKWAKTYNTGGTWSGDFGYWGDYTTDGGYVIIGTRGLEVTAWLVKTDSLGDTLWMKTYEDFEYFEPQCVQQTFDKGYIFTGKDFEPIPWYLWLVKTDSLGDTTWTKVFSEYPYGEGYYVQQTADSGYIVTGSSQQGLLLIKTYAPSGIEESQNTSKIKPIYLSVSPNPVTYRTRISYEVPEKFTPQLKLYDLTGRVVQVFKGNGQIDWSPRGLPVGYYFLSLTAGPYKETVKVVILK